MKKVLFTIAACANLAFLPAQIISFTDQGYRVEGERLAQKGMSNLAYALNGVFPGVQVVRENINGQTIAKLAYHGTASALVDMTVYLNGTEYVGSLDMINVNDIESVTLMREGQNVKYGHRSAEGVILIEMKKARAGKFSLTFQNQTGITTKALPYYEIMNDPAQMAEMIWEYQHTPTYPYASASQFDASLSGLLSPGLKFGYSSLRPFPRMVNPYQMPFYSATSVVGDDGKFNPEAKLLWHDKWREELVSVGLRQENHIQISGGDKLFNVRGSFGLVHEEGYLDASGTDRFNGLISLRSEPASWVKLGADIQASMMDSKQREQDYYYVHHDSPFRPIYNRNEEGERFRKDGTPYLFLRRTFNPAYGNDSGSGHAISYNPLSADSLRSSGRDEKMLAGNAFADFHYKGFYGGVRTDGIWWKSNNQLNEFYLGDDEHSVLDSKLNKVSFSQYVGWKGVFSNNTISADLRHEDLYTDGYTARSEGYLYKENYEVAFSQKSINHSDKMSHGDSWMANVNYDYDQRYFIHAGVLSERQPDYFEFIVDRVPRSLYYSAGARWNMKNESFLKDVKPLDNFLLFFDWAKLSPEKEKYVYASFDAESFTYLSGGAFLRLFNCVNLTANYFSRKTDELVTFDYLYSPITEPTNIYRNNMSVNTSGFDLNMQVDILKSKDWMWQLGLNLSHFKQTVKSQKYINDHYGSMEGKDLHHYDESGLKPVVDLKTGLLRFEKDENVSRKPEPDLFGGLSTNLRYKNFEMNLGMTFAIGGWVYDTVYESLIYGTDFVWHKDMKNRWSYFNEDNSNTTFPSLGDRAPKNYFEPYGLTKGSWFALDYVNVGYNFDKPILKKLGMKGLRVSLIGDNLFLISARKGFDPRSVSDYGVRFVTNYYQGKTRKGVANSVPLLRTFSLGLTMTL